MTGLTPLRDSFRFVLAHPFGVGALAMVSASGRALQLGAMGQLSEPWSILLELVVQPARVAIFLLVLGDGDIGEGFRTLRRGLTSKRGSQAFDAAMATLRRKWRPFAKSFLAFVLLAMVANLLIAAVAAEPASFEPPFKFDAKTELAERELALKLFLKNLSIIPLTIIYLAMLARLLVAASQLQPK